MEGWVALRCLCSDLPCSVSGEREFLSPSHEFLALRLDPIRLIRNSQTKSSHCIKHPSSSPAYGGVTSQHQNKVASVALALVCPSIAPHWATSGKAARLRAAGARSLALRWGLCHLAWRFCHRWEGLTPFGVVVRSEVGGGKRTTGWDFGRIGGGDETI